MASDSHGILLFLTASATAPSGR